MGVIWQGVVSGTLQAHLLRQLTSSPAHRTPACLNPGPRSCPCSSQACSPPRTPPCSRLQQVVGRRMAEAQAPARARGACGCGLEHPSPPLPQCWMLVILLTQAPMHTSKRSGGHLHRPLSQMPPTRQVWPPHVTAAVRQEVVSQTLQRAAGAGARHRRAVPPHHLPPTSVGGVAEEAHLPPAQTWPAAHELPQLPAVIRRKQSRAW